MPYRNYSTLSNPVLLTVVKYCDTELPLPCDGLLTCPASLPVHAGISLLQLWTAQMGIENGWVDGKLPRLTLGASFLSFTNEGCCCRGCCTSPWSIFMFFIDLNHVMILKELVWYFSTWTTVSQVLGSQWLMGATFWNWSTIELEHYSWLRQNRLQCNYQKHVWSWSIYVHQKCLLLPLTGSGHYSVR